MAATTKVGQLTQPTSVNHSFAVTGVGFQPKIVIFWCTSLTSDADAAGVNMNFGVGISSSDRRAVFSEYDDTATAQAGSSGHDNSKCIYGANKSGTVLFAADVVSMDSDGFTLDFGTVDSNARKINYLAIGGTDITNVKTGQLTEPGSNGDQAYTDPGFKPDVILLFQSRATTTAPPSQGNLSVPRFRLGIATASNQGVMATEMDYTTVSVGNGYQSASNCYESPNSGAGGILATASLKTMDTNGFTLTWANGGGTSGRYFFYIAIKGGQHKVGSFNQPGSTGTGNPVTGVGFQPVGIFLWSRNLVSSSTVDANARMSIGAASSTSSRASSWVGHRDNVATSIDDSDQDSTKMIKLMTEALLVAVTVNAAADLSSFDADGFTPNWTTADATAREILYWVIGSNAAVPTGFGTSRLLTGVGT